MDTLFSVTNLLVLPFWVLMIAAPGWSITLRLVRSPIIVLAPVVVYATLVFPKIAMILPAVINPKLETIALLLGSPLGATIAWLHFLAFDLLVGRWVYLDSREHRVPAIVMGPILFLVLMLGPIGLGLYLVLRGIQHGWQGKDSQPIG